MLTEANFSAQLGRVGIPEWLRMVEECMLETVSVSKHPLGLSEEAACQHLKSGGRRVRARIALDVCSKLSVCEEDAITIAACVELIHNASLIHDDIVDQSEWRRGTRTILSTHGDEVAICVGDLLLSAAFGILAKIKNVKQLPAVLTIVHRSVALAIHGQCAEQLPPPASASMWEYYEEIVISKSGALLLLPLELALSLGNRSEQIPAATRAVHAFAIAYQILDDIADVEIDRGNNLRSSAFNALLLLENFGHAGNSQRLAFSYAKSRLEESVETASKLSDSSGEIIVRMASEMLNS